MKGTFMANQVVTPSSQCLFCSLQQQGAQRIQSQNDNAFCIADAFPVTKGHSLIIPKRHIASFFDATEERLAMLALVVDAKAELDAQYQPAGYNLGINDGPAACQTVMPLHVHVIPRQGERASIRTGGAVGGGR